MRKRLITVAVLMISAGILAQGCRKDRTEELKNGVIFATRALEQAGANPLSQATYESYIARGGTPVDYIQAILPKTDPPFDSYEYGQPTHPWTIVIRPGTEPNEFFIEGYGHQLKQPVVVDSVTINLPVSE